MIKFVMCLHRHSDMTRKQFQDYWRNKHGPFFMKNAGSQQPRKLNNISKWHLKNGDHI